MLMETARIVPWKKPGDVSDKLFIYQYVNELNDLILL